MEQSRSKSMLNTPFLATGFCDAWPFCSLKTDKLAEILDGKVFACRVSEISCERTLETECVHLEISMDDFNAWLRGEAHQPNPLTDFSRSKYCCYIDYKYMRDMFCDNAEVFSHVKWSTLGLPEFDGSDSTIWIGSEGANTPCHQDTYGFNLVTQIQGRKLWILFPPEDTQFLYPTRIPFEESSIFSSVNIRNPDLAAFPLTKNSHPVIVTLNPGQTLFVPRHWWHYVQSLEPSISVNVWVPVFGDNESRYHEALTRTLASSLIRDFADVTDDDKDGFQHWLNPTETLTASSVNMEFLKTSLSQLLAEEDRECLTKDFDESETSHSTKRKSDFGHSDYLHKLALALANCPQTEIRSPVDLNSLKRKAVENDSGSKCLKTCKSSSDTKRVEPERLSGEDREFIDGNEEEFTTRQLHSLACCSVDVYLKCMRDLCDKSNCSCKRNSQMQDVSRSLITPVSRQRLSEGDKIDQSLNSDTVECESKILKAPCSLTSVAFVEGNANLYQQQSLNNILDSSARNSSENDTIGAVLSSEGKIKEDCQVNDVVRQGLLDGNLTLRDIAEAFLSSILQPDIIQAVAVKVREQCDILLRNKSKKL
ncbi:HSPB1-associated protein 1 [Elysia marginata]|uniref:HSPB1-associated protein 1 n=1 Tax=Elysia marginata TaxID=1093978 RepID=A0AAV4FMF5_9GAST|nr:HSPB1-associated protein 1 [Elysia marginata]